MTRIIICSVLVMAFAAKAVAAGDTYLIVNLLAKDAATAFSTRVGVPEGGWTVADKTTNLVLRLCEPGTFRMGASADDKQRLSALRQRDVTLTKPFYIGVFPLTEFQCEAICGKKNLPRARKQNPSATKSCVRKEICPVENISWSDAHWLGCELTGRFKRGVFTLPTSAQWEYAARAGATGRLYAAPEKVGQLNAPLVEKFPVGCYEPNAWGLYDLFGNGYQWCLDEYREIGSVDGAPEIDPLYRTPNDEKRHVIRGAPSCNFAGSDSVSLSNVTCLRNDGGSFQTGLRLVWSETNAASDDAQPKPPAAKIDARTMAVAEGNAAFCFSLPDANAAELRFAYAGTNFISRIDVRPQAQVVRDGWAAYRYRRNADKVSAGKIPEAKVVFSANREKWLTFDYMTLPYFDATRWNGIYGIAEIERSLEDWRTAYTPLREQTFAVELVRDARRDVTEAYVNGQYAGSVEGRGAVTSVTFRATAPALATFTERPPATEALSSEAKFRPLAPQPNPLRVNAALKRDATLSLAPGPTRFGDIPMNVWRLEESFDQGLHRETCRFDDIMHWGMLQVNGFANGPEFLQWNLPKRPWSAAWTLCASIDAGGHCDYDTFLRGVRETRVRHPISGVEFGEYGSTRGKLAVDVKDLPIESHTAEVLTNRDCRIVGTIQYRTVLGETKEAPVWLVRHKLDSGNVGAFAKENLGLGFVGGGTWDGTRKSNVQVLGCTLECSPVDFAVEQTVRGNIFDGDDKAETSVRLTATRPDVKGRLEWIVRDTNFCEMKRGAFDWSFANAGESQRFTLDLAAWGPGWYALDWRVVDDEGVEQLTHEAAFTQLGADTREAGVESPYGAWPQLGRHMTNPNREEEFAMMRKAGYHKGWHEAVSNEWQYADYPYTLTEWAARMPGMSGSYASEAEREARFEEDAVAFEKLRERFPHLNTIAVFHEEPPRRLANEIFGETKPDVEGERPDSPSMAVLRRSVDYMNAYFRYMHKRFPGVRIRLGNNSTGSERVAKWARAGLDLNLVDELGSEVMAFRSMPELAADYKSVGTMWGLKETGRLFGMTNVQVGASSEFVFRPERRVNREDPHHLRQTAYAVRDWLIALGHGCPYVISGHIEDCFSDYYDSDWGASGQCRPYPFSYPKRIYTALATLTKVFDKPIFKRRVPTGENTVIAFEFARDRKVKDYAYAFWTPEYDVEIAVRFAHDVALTHVDAFGVTRVEQGRTFTFTAGELPRYAIVSEPVEAIEIVAHPVAAAPVGFLPVPKPTPDPSVKPFLRARKHIDWDLIHLWQAREYIPSVPKGLWGPFENRIIEDPGAGTILECVPTGDGNLVPKVSFQYEFLKIQDLFPLADNIIRYEDPRGLGIWVRGNGGFGRVGFVFETRASEIHPSEQKILWAGNDGWIDFHGWQYLTVPLTSTDRRKSLAGYSFVGVIVGTGRYALDPLEMRTVDKPLAIGNVYWEREAKDHMTDDDAWVKDRQETRLLQWF